MNFTNSSTPGYHNLGSWSTAEPLSKPGTSLMHNVQHLGETQLPLVLASPDNYQTSNGVMVFYIDPVSPDARFNVMSGFRVRCWCPKTEYALRAFPKETTPNPNLDEIATWFRRIYQRNFEHYFTHSNVDTCHVGVTPTNGYLCVDADNVFIGCVYNDENLTQ